MHTFKYLLVFILILFASAAHGTDFFASPTGSGGTCSTGTPCTLATAQAAAQAGDSIVLKNGIYAQQVLTTRAGTAGNSITWKAENALQAIIKPPLPAPFRGRVMRILHSYNTIRGLVFDGQKFYHFMVNVTGTTGNLLQGVIFEENQVINSGGVGFSLQFITGAIIRHNLINSTGWFSTDPCCGEGFYASSLTDGQLVEDLQLYGNTIRDATANAIDLKSSPEIHNAFIHHNIIENHTYATSHGHPCSSVSGCPDAAPGHGSQDGLIVIFARNSEIEDNILRNNVSGSSIFRMRGNANNTVRDNVVLSSSNGSVIRGDGALALAASEVTGNTYCALSTYANHSDGVTGINVHDNTSNAALSVCNAEVARIITEMAALPRFTAISIAPPTALLVFSVTN